MAARNCLFLPALTSIIEQAMELPVTLHQEVTGAVLTSGEAYASYWSRYEQHTSLDLWKQN